MESCAEFKITEPGFYRTRDGKKVEVFGPVKQVEHAPWAVITKEALHYLVPDSGDFFVGARDPRDIVARWEEPEEKYERVAISPGDGDGGTREKRTYVTSKFGSRSLVEWYCNAPMERGFAGYIYERGGQEAISSLPCGWPVWEHAGTEAAYLVIAAEPNIFLEPPIFPVAWRRVRDAKKEGGK